MMRPVTDVGKMIDRISETIDDVYEILATPLQRYGILSRVNLSS